MRDNTNTSLPVILREHLFFDGNKPYTAFIAANAKDWKKFQDTGASDLTPLKPSIVLMVEGHEPTNAERASAEMMFKNLYTSATPPRSR